MKYANVQEAKAECERFLKRVKTFEENLDEVTKSRGWFGAPNPDAAAVKRSSLDLTKALAKMRKP